ncbi:serine--tRNA ligase [candidate division KSB1 bacterium]|nr:serine--tRNA ligase [candidate division KSB1 bacterium]RQW00970.1 MAG: serine--tRNA ligase [candidate division KSB1 bacterium]
MLDLKYIRENAERVKQAVLHKRENADVDALLELDVKRRELIGKVEGARAEQNKVTEKIAQMKKAGEEATSVIAEMRQLAESIKKMETELKTIEEPIYQLLIRIPNIPHDSVPVGGEQDNVVYKTWGQLPEQDFQPLPHYEIAEKLGIIDFGRASRMSGSFFVSYRGLGARMERALINFMIDMHVEKHGYVEVFPPFVAKREAMFGTGQLPKLEEDMYRCELDDLFLIPTAEVPVTNLHREEMLHGDDLPIKYTAYTPCFRREAGAYGKDTRGLMRIHQFNKVEMVKFVTPESSWDELESLLSNAEDVLQALELPYRVLTLATGDLSFAAAKCYDIEVYARGINKWLEVSSCSNYLDFQARRASIRFRRDKGAKPEFVHTLNGSGLALPRTVIAILENYQTDEGTIHVPPALRKYMGVDLIK